MANNVGDLLSYTAAGLMSMYRKRELSPVEVTRAYLDQINAHNSRLKAYIDVFEQSAMAQARASEQRFMSGMPVGLLEGIPLGVKDLLHIEGFATSAGSALFKDAQPAQVTSTVVARLLGAGAVLLGKTNLVEFAYGGWGTNRSLGTPYNPWDATVPRAAGGSSSGSGVAVAARLALGAIGTDTGGSVRIPAAYCGLTGLKTTQGRISNYAIEHVSKTLDTVGPMTRSAEDAALIMQTIHGPDCNDTQTLGITPRDFMTSLRSAITGTRVSMVHPELWGTVDDDVLKGVGAVINTFVELGCLRQDVMLPTKNLVQDQQDTGVIISSEAYENWAAAIDGKWNEGDRFSRARIAEAENVSASQYVQALQNRQSRKQEFIQIFQNTDVLILPTVPHPAPPLAQLDEKDLSPSRLTRFVGYYGLCAISLPCGFSRDGLPIGVQLVAAPFREDLLLRMGAAFQQRTAFHI